MLGSIIIGLNRTKKHPTTGFTGTKWIQVMMKPILRKRLLPVCTTTP